MRLKDQSEIIHKVWLIKTPAVRTGACLRVARLVRALLWQGAKVGVSVHVLPHVMKLVSTEQAT